MKILSLVRQCANIIVMAIFFSSQVNAENLSSYHVGNMTLKINTRKANAFLDGYKKVAKKLKHCEMVDVVVENPLIGKKNQMSIKRDIKGHVCRFIYMRDELWQYNCLLNSEQQMKLSIIFDKNAKNGSALGDFTPEEQKILFNNKICSYEKL